MVFTKFFLAAIMAVAVMGAPNPDHPPPQMPFDFAYAVRDDYHGVDFAHDESSDGKVISGSYRVALPDGRTQIVTFTSDYNTGYIAKVHYEGEAQYPQPQPGAYGPPSPYA